MASSAPIASHPLIPDGDHDDDESEWEYEYSTTETETFYVTLDLSKADFTSRDPVAAGTGPGSYEAGKETEVSLDPHAGSRNSDGENNDHDYGEGRQQGSHGGRQPPDEDESEVNRRKGEGAHRVQILELHSPSPVISYRGRVYTGQWCQNVGTELLLTQRDPSSSSSDLPALRHLEGGSVALLAASSARISAREQELKPRDDGAGAGGEGAGGGERSRGPAADLVPLPDRGATRERLQQGRFLADLIALKRRRGETDEVTVIAKNVHRKSARRDEGGAGPRRAKGRPPRPPRQQYTPGSARGRARGGGRGKGRGKGRGGGGELDHLRDISFGAGSIDSSTAPPVAEGATGSAPTPSHWGGFAGQDAATPAREDQPMEEDGDEDEEGADEDEDDDDNDDSVSGSGDDEDEDDEDEEIGDMDVDED